MADSGVENVNDHVDEFLEGSPLRMVLARVEISQSNSMIEAFWRSLRHGWLYLHPLDSAKGVRSLVKFYVRQHNAVMPHSAFKGLTPDEVYFDRAGGVTEGLTGQRAKAREERLTENRSRSCSSCNETNIVTDFTNESKSVAVAHK